MRSQHSAAEKIKEISGTNPLKCMKCGKCSATCPSFNEMDIKPHQFVSYVVNEDIEALVNSKSLWKCLSCFACVERCPRDVKPGKLIDAARQLVVREKGGELGHDLAGGGAVLHIPMIAEAGVGDVVVDVEFRLCGALERLAKGAETVRFAAIDADICLRAFVRLVVDLVHSFQKEKFGRDGTFTNHFTARAVAFEQIFQPHRRAKRVSVRAHMAENGGALQFFKALGHFF